MVRITFCGPVIESFVIYVKVFVLPFVGNGILTKKHFEQGKAFLNLNFKKNCL